MLGEKENFVKADIVMYEDILTSHISLGATDVLIYIHYNILIRMKFKK
jgi:hypothetical protein